LEIIPKPLLFSPALNALNAPNSSANRTAQSCSDWAPSVLRTSAAGYFKTLNDWYREVWPLAMGLQPSAFSLHCQGVTMFLK
jgi:hypothetical protein